MPTALIEPTIPVVISAARAIKAGCIKQIGANERPIAPLNTAHVAYFNPGFCRSSIACVANKAPSVPRKVTPKYAHLFTIGKMTMNDLFE